MSVAIASIMMRIGAAARPAATGLREAPAAVKNAALLDAAASIEGATEEILHVNRTEIDAADGMTPAFLDRMMLTSARIADMAASLRTIAALPDPVGAVIKEWARPNGLAFQRIRTPIGVVAIIYESRPNVTIDEKQKFPRTTAAPGATGETARGRRSGANDLGFRSAGRRPLSAPAGTHR